MNLQYTHTLTNLSTTTNSFRFNNCDDGILSTVFCETTFALFPITIFISLHNVTRRLLHTSGQRYEEEDERENKNLGK